MLSFRNICAPAGSGRHELAGATGRAVHPPFGYFAGIIILPLGSPPRPAVSWFTANPLRDLPDQTTRHFGRIIPTLVGRCWLPFLGGSAQSLSLPTFRAIATCSGGHPIPLESSPFDGLIISQASAPVKNFFWAFLRGARLVLGSNARWKACTSPLWRPLARLSAGVPRRGWGPHPLLTLALYHFYKAV